MTEFLYLPEEHSLETRDFDRKVISVVNGVINGKTNNTGEITLGASTATTSVSLASGRIGEDTQVHFMATTSNAASELAGGSMFVSSRDVANNLFRVTHANNAQTDRIFKFILVG